MVWVVYCNLGPERFLLTSMPKFKRSREREEAFNDELVTQFELGCNGRAALYTLDLKIRRKRATFY